MNPMNHQRLASAVINRRMLVALVMGFSCGLPLLLTLSVLQAWMTESGVDLTTIGLMTLVGLPYALKFCWAPLFDRYTLPLMGRRRGWLLVSQLSLMAALVWLGFSNPVAHPRIVGRGRSGRRLFQRIPGHRRGCLSAGGPARPRIGFGIIALHQRLSGRHAAGFRRRPDSGGPYAIFQGVPDHGLVRAAGGDHYRY